MKKLFASIAVVLLLGGCTALGLNDTKVSTVKAQQTVDLLQSTRTTVLTGEVIYLQQAPCGLAASPPPPLCASYAVGKEMRRLNGIAGPALAKAQTAIDNAGANPGAVDAAVAAAKLAVSELQTYALNNGVTR